MLDTTLGIITLIIVCAAFLVLGLSYSWRRRHQSVEDYTVSRNHASSTSASPPWWPPCSVPGSC